MVEIEAQLVERNCLVGTYCSNLLLHVVGALRKYHCCIMVSQVYNEIVVRSWFEIV